MQPMGTQYHNPYASANLNGLNDPYPYGYVDRPAWYPQTITFAADGLFVNQAIPIGTDADFIWRALVVKVNEGYSVRWQDASGTYLSNSLILAELLSTAISTPFPIWPEVPFPAGSRISADININTGISPITLQLVYIGVNRYRLPNRVG